MEALKQFWREIEFLKTFPWLLLFTIMKRFQKILDNIQKYLEKGHYWLKSHESM